MKSKIGSFIMMAFLVGCGGEPKPEGSIPRVENDSRQNWTRSKLILLNSYSGIKENHPIIDNSRKLCADPQGNIYLLDGKKQCILKFDSQLNFRQKIGSRGQGPGEFNYPLSISVDGQGSLYVADLDKISVFDSSGKFNQTHRTPFGIKDLDFNHRSGRLIIKYQKTEPPENNRYQFGPRRWAYLAEMDINPFKLKNFFQKEQFFFKKFQNKDFVFYLPFFVIFCQSKNRIYAASGDQYIINVYDQGHKLIRQILKQKPPIPVKKELLKTGRRLLEKNPPQRKQFELTVKHYALIKSLGLDNEQNLWVELYQPHDTYKNSYQTEFDIFAPGGKYLRSVRIKEKLRTPPLFTGRCIVAAIETGEGELLLNKYSLGTEPVTE